MIAFAVTAVLGLALLPGTIQVAYAQQAKPKAAPAESPIPKSLLFSDKEADLIQRVVRERRAMPQKEVKDKEELELPPDLRPVKQAQAKPEGANANLPQVRVQAVMQTRSTATLHLPAIMYFNPKKWTIWLNGAMITPNRVPSYLEGIKVGSNSVELSLRRGKGLKPITVRLRANETYIIGTGEVIQGPPPSPPEATEGKDNSPAVPQTPYVPPPEPEPQPAATEKTAASAGSSSDVEAAVGAAEKALNTLKALTTGGATSGSK